MEENKMKKHVSVVGALNIGFGGLGIIVALVLYFVFSFARSFVPGEEIPEMVLQFIGAFLPGIIFVISALNVIGGIGLLAYKQWARIIVLVVSVIGLLNIPLGTFKGVYSLWVLLQDETNLLFSSAKVQLKQRSIIIALTEILQFSRLKGLMFKNITRQAPGFSIAVKNTDICVFMSFFYQSITVKHFITFIQEFITKNQV